MTGAGRLKGLPESEQSTYKARTKMRRLPFGHCGTCRARIGHDDLMIRIRHNCRSSGLLAVTFVVLAPLLLSGCGASAELEKREAEVAATQRLLDKRSSQ